MTISPQLLAEEEEEEGRKHSARTLETVWVAEAVDWGACWGGGVF